MSSWVLAWVFCALACFACLALFIWNQRLRARVKKLKEESARQALWTAYISHELRSPLSVTLLHLSLLNTSKTLPPDAQLHVRGALGAGEHLKSLVNDTLDAASMKSASFAVKKGLVSITHIMSEVYDLFKETANSKNLDLQLYIEKGIPGELWLDGLRFKQLLINLVDNSIKHTFNGYIKISLLKERTKSKLSLFGGPGESDTLKVLVADSGNGISKENMARIFEPFYTTSPQSDSPFIKDKQSTGLGLAVVKSVAQVNGWHIDAQSVTKEESSVLHGTTFTVTIPLAPNLPTPNLAQTHIFKQNHLLNHAPLDLNSHTNSTNPASQTLAQTSSDAGDEHDKDTSAPGADGALSILIIDDLVVNRHVLRLALKRIVENAFLDNVQKKEAPNRQHPRLVSTHFEETGSGEDAVKLLRAKPFDLILLDWNMPGLSGAQLLTQICGLKKAQTRVAVISGQLDQNLKDICEIHGVQDLLTKPVDLSSLAKLITTVLNSSDSIGWVNFDRHLNV